MKRRQDSPGYVNSRGREASPLYCTAIQSQPGRNVYKCQHRGRAQP